MFLVRRIFTPTESPDPTVTAAQDERDAPQLLGRTTGWRRIEDKREKDVRSGIVLASSFSTIIACR